MPGSSLIGLYRTRLISGVLPLHHQIIGHGERELNVVLTQKLKCMPLLYRAIQSILASKDGKKRWHPRLIKFKKAVDTQKIGEMIAAKSSLTPGDVHSVMRNLVDVMSNSLMNSQTVRLDGFGTFTVVAISKGKGVESSEEVSHSQITHLKIRFTPASTYTSGKVTRTIFNGVAYERWDKGSASVVTDGEEQPGGGSPGTGDIYIDPNA
jgi:predicted histone-like DNA-binding protein